MPKPSFTRTVVILFKQNLEVNKGIHAFGKGISPVVNVIARLEIETAYLDVIVQHVSHNAAGNSPIFFFSVEVTCLIFISLSNLNTWLWNTRLTGKGQKINRINPWSSLVRLGEIWTKVSWYHRTGMKWKRIGSGTIFKGKQFFFHQRRKSSDAF